LKNKIILHIPHSSTNIPLMNGYDIDEITLGKEMLKLTDWFTDDLFHTSEDDIIKADFSRIFCDTERFIDDTQEVMSQYGMGVIYTKNDDGETIRNVTSELREKILMDYYWHHHTQLSNTVNNHLTQFGKALIIDCHSFPSVPLKRDLDKTPNRPDFNIGTDPYHTPNELIDASIAFFKKAGYSLGINWPYKGSIVPLEHYHKNQNVQSIMLEINRKLYLKEPSNEKSENYQKIKDLTRDFIKVIKTAFNSNFEEKILRY